MAKKGKHISFESKVYKDTVFRMLFRERKELLELYNALNGTSYTNEENLIVTTLEGETFLGMKNDVSYIFNDELNLYEHQSTPCPNIPLRDLSYVASIYREQVDISKTYKSIRMKIPTPKFVVFYNGTIPMEDIKEYKLSDMFESKTDDPELELKVNVYNINEGHNKELLDTCNTLKGYSIFVGKVRKCILEIINACNQNEEHFLEFDTNNRKAVIGDAVNQAIDWCIENEVLKDFFIRNREEVVSVGVLEYSAEKHMQVIRDESYDLGLDEGISGAVEILVELGLDRQTISDRICKQYQLTPDQVQKYFDICG